MRIELPDTTVSKISKALVKLRDEAGAVALGRVLTLVVSTTEGLEEEVVEAANEASREHPCRVLVLSKRPGEAETRLDAQIRVGSDAGASEVVILKVSGELLDQDDSVVSGLLLPDAPIVAWWPHELPECPSKCALGSIAHRRITDSANLPDPFGVLRRLSENYAEGDTDFAWTRLTYWREQIAAVFDHLESYSVTNVKVTGGEDSPSTILLASWLGRQLNVEVAVEHAGTGAGIIAISMDTTEGNLSLTRPPGEVMAELVQPGEPTHRVALPRRELKDCLAEELRRLDPDEIYGEVLTEGLKHCKAPVSAAS